MGRGKPTDLKHADAVQCVRLLCAVTEVPEPDVNWSARNVRGSYQDWRGKFGTINVGPRVSDGIAAVIHEVAHHHIAMNTPRPSRAERRWQAMHRQRRTIHGRRFVETLTALATAWYGDPMLYPWETEYSTVAAGAPRKEEA